MAPGKKGMGEKRGSGIHSMAAEHNNLLPAARKKPVNELPPVGPQEALQTLDTPDFSNLSERNNQILEQLYIVCCWHHSYETQQSNSLLDSFLFVCLGGWRGGKQICISNMPYTKKCKRCFAQLQWDVRDKGAKISKLILRSKKGCKCLKCLIIWFARSPIHFPIDQYSSAKKRQGWFPKRKAYKVSSFVQQVVS